MTWEQALQGEQQWWGSCTNTADEEAKQLRYAELMGIDSEYRVRGTGWFFPPFDLKQRSVLDIGGGPVSLLLKCKNFKYAAIVDPGNWPGWVMDRYRAAHIEYTKVAAEDVSLGGVFDEVWIYNTLQHVKDPERVAELALKHGRTVRVFEWIDTETNEMHPHSLTKEYLNRIFSTNGNVHEVKWVNYPERAWVAEIDSGRKKAIPMNTYTFHLLGLAHIPTHPDYSPCAYSMKVEKMARMLKSMGHKVHFYGTEGSKVECDEFIQVSSEQDRLDTYGDYDWKSDFFKHDPGDRAHQIFNANAITEINKRKSDRDFLLCPMGNYHQSVANAVGLPMTVESGIGYTGVFAKYRVFESYTWMMYVYGLLKQGDGSWYDAVIPNYFDLDDFPYQEDKDDYYLYMGRITLRKGVDIAAQVTERIGSRLIMAGQGSLQSSQECIDLTNFSHIEHIGAVGPKKRAELMGRARAVFVPTYYIEPFGGVAVEAQLCGTPVLTTDWGVFSETVMHGTTGWRCRTLDDFVWAATRGIEQISPASCREWAEANFSMDRVRLMYQEYFTKLQDIFNAGWYELRPGRSELSWLTKQYPNGRHQ